MSSIREVALKAGVSPATVSRTFSTPDLINEQTQKKVLEAAQLLNYRPPHLRVVKSRRTVVETISGTVGFQFFAGFPEDTLTSNFFYAPVLAGALSEADAQGLHLLVHTTDRHSMSLEVPRMVREKAVNGLLLVGTTDAPIIDEFANYVLPIILVDNSDRNGRFESVVSDGFGGAFEATRYLQALGHRKISFFLPEENIYTFSDRLYGYLSAHYEAGVEPDQRLILRGFSDDAGREAALVGLLQSAEPPTALFCANDDHAIMALRICRQIGVRVPEDLSIIGFDNTPFSTTTEPLLTTVHVDTEKMGKIAIQRLINHLNKREENVTRGVQNRMPVSLVIRGSCRVLTS